MTTSTEIGELEERMGSKFQKVYDDLAELRSEQHGMAKDMAALKVDVADLKTIVRENAVAIATINQRLDLEFGRIDDQLGEIDQQFININGKLDQLLARP